MGGEGTDREPLLSEYTHATPVYEEQHGRNSGGLREGSGTEGQIHTSRQAQEKGGALWVMHGIETRGRVQVRRTGRDGDD